MSLFVVFLAAQALSGAPADSADDMRREIIDASIAAYHGNCPCPYHRASNGSRCGGRSAWSRAGGDDPYCFDRDIADENLDALYEIAISRRPHPALLNRLYPVTPSAD